MRNDTATLSTTPTLDTLHTVLAATLSPALRWGLKGWAAHLRQSRHQIHAANSWAKHRHEFGALYEQAMALTVARCVDYGMEPEEATALLWERAEAREMKAAA
jgi:hypothetical protein